MRCLLFLFILLPAMANAQPAAVLLNSHGAAGQLAYNPALKPFYHGVASGDPLQSQVIIWTRVTPDSGTTGNGVSGNWYVATDTGMTNLVQQGVFTTDSSVDFTVKVDVQNLNPGTTYYYMFTTGGVNSIRGRTRTLPVGNPGRLKFAVVSCNNYEAGFFTAYRHLAQRNDIDAVLHLGDYIYEYKAASPGDSNLMRFHQQFETVTKAQYRARYSLYRLDPDLQAAHQQHAFINIWDDHESANDSWEHGAQNHNPATEGPWSLRKAASKEAFFEWLPIRNNAQNQIYRSFSFGNLADLIMLDTRLEGRNEQLHDVADSSLFDTARTILGSGQRNWFINELSTSAGRWRIIGNQVIFAQMQFGWVGPVLGMTAQEAESQFLDIWDGYPAERQRVISHLDTAGIDNSIFITGDFHCSFAFDIADTVVNDSANYAPVPNYDPQTGAGSVAVEFATPSISSSNFDERFNSFAARLMEQQINAMLGAPYFNNPNPHMKFVDLDRHGYIILDVRADSVKANWYFTEVKSPGRAESFGKAMKVLNAENHLRHARQSSPGPVQYIPAPAKPLRGSVDLREEAFAIVSAYPNPASGLVNLQLAASTDEHLLLKLLDMRGVMVKDLGQLPILKGISEVQLNLSGMAAGAYLLQLSTGTGQRLIPLILK